MPNDLVLGGGILQLKSLKVLFLSEIENTSAKICLNFVHRKFLKCQDLPKFICVGGGGF